MIGRIFAAVASVFLFLATITVVFGSWYTIDQGERGVLLRNGALTGTAEPGLGFKMPWIDSVHQVSVQSQVRTYNNDQGGLAVYSRDQQTATVRLSVNYHADPSQIAALYERYGSLDGAVTRLIDPKVYEQTKNVFGRFNAITAVQERGRLNTEIEEAVRAGVGASAPIIVESVQIENIDFSDAYEQSIEARMLAEVEVQKLRQNAEREKVQAEITVTQAKAQADAVRATAEAEADAIRIRGDAEADAIKARGDALRDNPGLVALTQAEKWNGQLPQTMLPDASVPMLNLGAR